MVVRGWAWDRHWRRRDPRDLLEWQDALWLAWGSGYMDFPKFTKPYTSSGYIFVIWVLAFSRVGQRREKGKVQRCAELCGFGSKVLGSLRNWQKWVKGAAGPGWGSQTVWGSWAECWGASPGARGEMGLLSPHLKECFAFVVFIQFHQFLTYDTNIIWMNGSHLKFLFWNKCMSMFKWRDLK